MMNNPQQTPIPSADELLANIESGTFTILILTERAVADIVAHATAVTAVMADPNAAQTFERCFADLRNERNFIDQCRDSLVRLDTAHRPAARQRYDQVVSQIQQSLDRVEQARATLIAAREELEQLQKVAAIRQEYSSVVNELTASSADRAVPQGCAEIDATLTRLNAIIRRLALIEPAATELAELHRPALQTAVTLARSEGNEIILIYSKMRDAQRTFEDHCREIAMKTNEATTEALKGITASQRQAFTATQSKPTKGGSKHGR